MASENYTKKARGLSLLSGGLDSQLAVCVLRDAGAEKAAEWYMISVNGKDCAHPTKAGAKRFAELFVRAVRDAGGPVSALFRPGR